MDYGWQSQRALARLEEVRHAPLVIPELDETQRLRLAGQPLQALHRLEEMVKFLDAVPARDDMHRLLWLRCHEQILDCLADTRQFDAVKPTLDRFMQGVQRTAGNEWKQELGKQYKRLIQLDVHLGQHADALGIFAEGRDCIDLDDPTTVGLALAAASLKQTDPSAIELYLRCLPLLRTGQDAQRPIITAVLRDAIRIDLEIPADGEIPSRIGHNDRVYQAECFQWARAYKAMGLFRLGRRTEAFQAIGDCRPVDLSDNETVLLLGILACYTEDWDQAENLLSSLANVDACRNAAAYYIALSQAHHALLHPDNIPALDMYRRTLAQRQQRLDATAVTGVRALDGQWVRLQLAVACDDAARIEASLQPSAMLPRWRQLASWAAELWVRDRRDMIEDWAKSRPSQDRHGLCVASAAKAIGHLLSGDVGQAQLEVQIAQRLAVDPAVAPVDDDLAAGATLLAEELAWLGGGEPVPATLDAGASPAIGAHRLRLQAWEAVEQGRFAEALGFVAEPMHHAGPAWQVQRIELVARAYAGELDAAEPIAKALAAHAPRQPMHRLMLACVHVAQNRFDQAIEDLAGLDAEESPWPEGPLMMGECLLRTNRPDQAKAMLQRAARRLTSAQGWPLLPRPWRLKVPPQEWALGPTLGRLADACHLAGLLLETQQAELAAQMLLAGEKLLPSSAPEACRWLGALQDQAAMALMAAGRLEEACRLRQMAARHVGANLPFIEALAAATKSAPDPAVVTDDVLQQFLEYAGARAELGPKFQETLVARLLMEALRIDDLQPPAAAEWDRRKAFTETLAGACGQWPWPRTNLARSELRANEPTKCLNRVEQIPEGLRQGEDFWLRGQALLRLERFGEAAPAFARAREMEFEVHAARILGGFCRICALWRDSESQATDLAPLLVDFDLPPSAPAVPRNLADLAVLCRAAVLLKMGRCSEAEKTLASFEPAPEFRALAAILLGLAKMRLGRDNEARELWSGLAQQIPDSDDLQIFLLWALCCDPRQAAMQAIEGQLLVLHRANRKDLLPLILEAQFELRRGQPAVAGKILELAATAAPVWQMPVLALLNEQVAAEMRWVRARHQAAQREFPRAMDAVDKCPELWLAPWRAPWLAGLCRLHIGEVQEGLRQLEPLAQAGCCVAASLGAQGAFIAKDHAAAARLKDLALGIDPAQPLALLVAAQLAEGQGQAQAARQWRLKALEDADRVDPWIVANAMAGLGRTAEEAGDLDQAREYYEKARSVGVAWGVPAGRLAFLTARTPKAPAAAAEAAMTLLDAVPPANRPLGNLLAAAMLADRLHRPAQQAAALAMAMVHKDFTTLDNKQQQIVARWSIVVQVQQEQFTQAASAIKALLAQEDTPELRDLLVNCRLMEVSKLLRDKVSDPQILDQVTAAVDDVLVQRPDHLLAKLLAATLRLLRGNVGSGEHEQRVREFQDVQWPSENLQLLAEINRMFAGGGSMDHVEPLVRQTSLDKADKDYLLLLAANQYRQLDRLAELSAAALQDPASAAAAMPVSPLAAGMLLARHFVAQGQADKALDVLGRLQDAGISNEDAVNLHATVLVKESVHQLADQRLTEAQSGLAKARKLLSPSAQGVS